MRKKKKNNIDKQQNNITTVATTYRLSSTATDSCTGMDVLFL